MTDWDRVERLRRKGLSWEEIAADEKVGFSPPSGSGRPGLALKALYLQRRSKLSRAMRSGAARTEGAGRSREGRSAEIRKKAMWRHVAFVGTLVALAAAVPLALSLEWPIVVAIVPFTAVAVVAVIGVVLLGASFVIASRESVRNWKRNVASGLVAGLLVGLVLVGFSLASHCPSLSSSISPEPGFNRGGTWEKASNPVWSNGNAPIVLYWGSTACPYCSASSWALKGALQSFGSLTGTSYGMSDPGDVYGNGQVGIAEVVLDSSSSLQSSYVSWDPQETVQAHVSPVVPSCPEGAYIQAYAGGNLPFVVVGGLYVHIGTLLDPGCLTTAGCGGSGGTPLTWQQVEADLNSTTGPVYGAIHEAQYYLEAYMLKAVQLAQGAGAGPPGVKNDPNVIGVFDGIN